MLPEKEVAATRDAQAPIVLGVPWQFSAAVLNELITKARSGTLSAKEQAFLGERLEYFHDETLRLESLIHDMTK